MEKLLTVSIAAYNVSNYIRETLESLIIPELIDELEIFVIDDGGQDETLSIAKEYADLYPDSIFPIHKENGGYGTVFNCAIGRATGKYFKLLDGDDWFDKEGLIHLIDILKNSSADVLVTNYYKGSSANSLTIQKILKENTHKVYQISDFKPESPAGMWTLVYKTEILKKVKLSLPGNSLYTDQYYSTIPFSAVNTVETSPISVYCYRVGNDEQSSSRISRIKHTDEMLRICRDLSVFAENSKEKDCYSYVLSRSAVYHISALKTIMLDKPGKANRQKLIDYDRKVRNIAPSVYERSGKQGKWGKVIFLMRVTNYLAYWLIKLLPGGIPNWQ